MPERPRLRPRLTGVFVVALQNKGPHIVAATATLHDILARMHSHQKKKRALLRSLKVSRPFDTPHLLADSA